MLDARGFVIRDDRGRVRRFALTVGDRVATSHVGLAFEVVGFHSTIGDIVYVRHPEGGFTFCLPADLLTLV